MLLNAALVLSLLSATSALYTGRREDQPSDADLFASCPGGPGSSNVEKADRCTLVNIVNNPDTFASRIIGSPQANCNGGTEDIVVTFSGSTSVSHSTTVNADLGIDLDGISIDGGGSSDDSTETVQSESIQFSVPPGMQAVYVASVRQTSQTGNVQVNYGDRQFGHFIWFTAATVTQLTPQTDDSAKVFDVHQSPCGTDPTDLSNFTPS